jgi:hypothetical protein
MNDDTESVLPPAYASGAAVTLIGCNPLGTRFAITLTRGDLPEGFIAGFEGIAPFAERTIETPNRCGHGVEVRGERSFEDVGLIGKGPKGWKGKVGKSRHADPDISDPEA